MSISEQVKELRKMSQQYPVNIDIDLFERTLNQAADTIESLSAKLQVANMEQSAADCGGGWIPCKERLPEEDVNVLVQVSGTYRNITFENAFEFATYIKGEGWILETYPDWNNPYIIAWQPLPEPYHEP